MPDKMQPEVAPSEKTLALVAQVASAYLSHNSVATAEIPHVITTIYQSLTKIGTGSVTLENRPEPAVPVKKSVFPDYIVCLEDGKKLKMLKRHLKTAYNLTPDQYRERWSLGPDYPLVAPNYAKQRSKLAKQIGLGTGRRSK